MKKVLFIILTASLISLCACNKADSSVGTGNSVNMQGSTTNDDFTGSNESSKNNNSHIGNLGQLTENVYVAYDKTPYQNISAKCCYYTKYMPITENMISELFSKAPNITYDGYGNTFFETNSERGFFSHMDEASIDFSYCTDFGNDMDSAVYNKYSMFSTNREFGFISRNDLISKMTLTLSKFVPSNMDIQIYSVTKNDYLQIISETTDEEKENSYTWSDGTDFYYIVANQTVDEIPIFSGIIGNPNIGTVTNGSICRAVYTENGLEYLYVWSPYVIEEEVHPEQDFISVDNAEIILKNICESLLFNEPITYTSVKLVYIPLNTPNGRLLLTPAWEFSDGKFTVNYINAFTGEEII